MAPNKMDNDEWRRESIRRLALVSRYFKPKELQAVRDFITTATDVSKEEKETKKEDYSI